MLTDEKCITIVAPVETFPVEKAKWITANPNIKINETVKGISMAMLEVPDPVLIGKTKQQQAIIIICAIYYTEK